MIIQYTWVVLILFTTSTQSGTHASVSSPLAQKHEPSRIRRTITIGRWLTRPLNQLSVLDEGESDSVKVSNLPQDCELSLFKLLGTCVRLRANLPGHYLCQGTRYSHPIMIEISSLQFKGIF